MGWNMDSRVSDQINERLARLETQAEHTDKVLDRQTEILEKVQNVLVEQAVSSERISRVHDRLDSVESQVDKNKTQIARWAGVISVLTVLAGWFGKDLLSMLAGA